MRRCLFCRAPLRRPSGPEATASIRFAYDPEAGRAWLVCAGCGRWNLGDVEERAVLIDRLEHRVKRIGRLLAATENIALLEVGRTGILRVGPSPLVEQAWWRYGRVLRGRWSASRGVGARIGAYTGGAVAYVGGVIGPRRRIPSYAWDDSALTEALRWWRFGDLAWTGRSHCSHCRSVLVALGFDDSWHTHLVSDRTGRLELGVPCPRCDPWTPDKLFRIQGEDAELLLRRILAYQNISGGTARMIERAGDAIAGAGTAADFTARIARDNTPLRRLGAVGGLALEIAINDDAERRTLQQQARALVEVWRHEDEIARIVDEEL
jgi:hypothetical protein